MKRLKALLSRMSPLARLSVLCLAVAWWALPMRNGLTLRWLEECSLFDGSEFATRLLLRYPGGLLQYAGSWLMQFMYIPVLGSLILIGLWVLLVWVTVRAFALSRHVAPIALLAPLCLLFSVLQIDENWFTISYRGYLFAPTLGFIFAVSAAWCVRKTGSWTAASGITLLTGCLYPWLGYFALLGTVLQSLTVLTTLKSRGWGWLAVPVCAVAVIAAVPELYFNLWPGTWVEPDHLLVKGLPDLIFNREDLPLWTPFILASVALALASAMPGWKRLGASDYAEYAITMVVAVGCIWSVRIVEKPEQYRAMILMQMHAGRMEWHRVVAVADRMEGPLTTELAFLASMGRQACGLPAVQYPVVDPDPASMPLRKRPGFLRSVFVNVPADMYLGEPLQSYRWAMEHSVKYGNRVFLLKAMVKDCLLTGDYELAQRYNDMLGATLFHKDWSRHYQRFIDNPALMEKDPEFRLMEKRGSKTVFYR